MIIWPIPPRSIGKVQQEEPAPAADIVCKALSGRCGKSCRLPVAIVDKEYIGCIEHIPRQELRIRDDSQLDTLISIGEVL
jgi:hypothetical protein